MAVCEMVSCTTNCTSTAHDTCFFFCLISEPSGSSPGKSITEWRHTGLFSKYVINNYLIIHVDRCTRGFRWTFGREPFVQHCVHTRSITARVYIAYKVQQIALTDGRRKRRRRVLHSTVVCFARPAGLV